MRHLKIVKASAVLFVLVLALGGCVAAGPHLTFQRGEEAGPAGEGELIPPIESVTQLQGSGATLSRSSNYRNYGGSSATSGATARGQLYRQYSPELAVGRRLLIRE